MSGDLPPLRHDADGAAPPIPLDDVDPRSPRSPTVVFEPMELPADVTGVRLEHRHRSADVAARDGRCSPIPHYADAADARNRTTAKTPVTHVARPAATSASCLRWLTFSGTDRFLRGKGFCWRSGGVAVSCLRGRWPVIPEDGGETSLFAMLRAARGDGTYFDQITRLAKVSLLVIDDFGLTHLESDDRLALLEILDDRYHRLGTIVAAQLPISKWHEVIGEPTIADAVMDRLAHTPHIFDLKGGSRRKATQLG